MKRYTDRRRSRGKEYQVGDLVMLSTKNLKWQMKGRRLEKLMKYFVGSYKIKDIVSTNTVELVLPSTVQIHPVVNISKIQLYKEQVEGQKRVPLSGNRGKRREI